MSSSQNWCKNVIHSFSILNESWVYLKFHLEVLHGSQNPSPEVPTGTTPFFLESFSWVPVYNEFAYLDDCGHLREKTFEVGHTHTQLSTINSDTHFSSKALLLNVCCMRWMGKISAIWWKNKKYKFKSSSPKWNLNIKDCICLCEDKWGIKYW